MRRWYAIVLRTVLLNGCAVVSPTQMKRPTPQAILMATIVNRSKGFTNADDVVSCRGCVLRLVVEVVQN